MRTLIAAFVVLAIAVSCQGVIHVDRLDGGTSFVVPSGQAFSLNTTGGEVRVYADNPNLEIIGLITVSGSGTLNLVIARNTAFSTGTAQVSAANAGGFLWNGITGSGPTVRVMGRVNGALQGFGITAANVYRFDVGFLGASITRTGSNNNFIVFVNGGPSPYGSGGGTGSITAQNGDIDTVDIFGNMEGNVQATIGSIGSVTSGGHIRGDIRAPQGSITTISAGGEISRTSDSPGNRLAITAMDGIGRVGAHTIRANIAANSGGTGTIGRVRTTVGSLIGSVAASALTSSTVGDGLLVAGNLEAAISIPGSLSAPIRVGGNVQNGGSFTGGSLLNANDAEIDITGNLTGNLSVGAVSRRVRVQGAVSSGRTLTTGAINNVSTSSLVIGGAVNGAVSVNGNISAASSVGGGIPGTLTVNGNVAAPVNVSGGVSGSLTINSTVTSPVTITGGAFPVLSISTRASALPSMSLNRSPARS
ncbi:MAG: hypothetical protein AB7U18_24505 [Dehalococcoidia bacterium]